MNRQHQQDGGGVTIVELVGWLFDAQLIFDNMGLSYDSSIEVRIETAKMNPIIKGNWGYVDINVEENGRVLHLNASATRSLIKATAVHEYFHHAQARSKLPETVSLLGAYALGAEGEPVWHLPDWFIEGSALWFEDEVFDGDNLYALEHLYGPQILWRGLCQRRKLL